MPFGHATLILVCFPVLGVRGAHVAATLAPPRHAWRVRVWD